MTLRDRLTLGPTRTAATRGGTPLRLKLLAARLAVVGVLCLAASAPARGQNVQFTQGGVNSGLENTIQIPIASYPGRGTAALPVTLYYSSRVWRIGPRKTVRAAPEYSRTVAEAIYSERSAAGWTTSLDIPTVEWPKPDDYYWYDGDPTHSLRAGFNYKVANVFIHMPGGATHELRKQDAVYAVSGPGVDMVGTFYAVDGSRMRFVNDGVNPARLYLPDGSRYELDGADARFIDRNGNTLLYDGANRRWTDTLGTTLRGHIQMPWPANPQAGADYAYAPPGFSAPYVFRWKRLSEVLTPPQPGEPTPHVRPMSDYYLPDPGADPTAWNAGNFPQPVPPTGPTPLFHSDTPNEESVTSFTYVVGRGQGAGHVFDPAVLAEVVLPSSAAGNVVSYKFTYNEYGEIDKIIYPTGGYERLKFARVPAMGNVQVPYSEASRGVQLRRVSPTGAAADEAEWKYAVAPSGRPHTRLLKTTAPDMTVTKSYQHNFYTVSRGNFGYQDSRNGVTYEECSYTKDPDTEGGVMLRRTLTEWGQTTETLTGPVPPGHNYLTPVTYYAHRNPRPLKSVSLMLDTGGAALAKKITHAYGASDPANAWHIERTTGLDQTGTTESYFAEVDQTTAATGAVETISGYPFAQASSTTTVYLKNEAYRSRNMLGLVTSVTLKDAAGQPVSKTETFYDEAGYPLITYGDLAGDAGYTDPATAARGNPTTVRRYVNASASVGQGQECQVGVCLQTHAQFDQAGNPIYFWDERAAAPFTEANANAKQDYSPDYKRAYLTQTTFIAPDPSGQHGSGSPFISHITYEAATGLVLTTRDANDQVTTLSYLIDGAARDPLNRLRKATRPDGSWTRTDYNDVPGNFYVHTETQLDASRSTHSYRFLDGLGRVGRTFARELGANYIVTETRYDRMGRVSQTSNPFRTTIDGTGSPTQAAFWETAGQPTGWTKNEYDELGRVKKVTLPDETFVTTVYDGVYTTVTDQAGRQRRQKTDALGRVIRVDEPDASGNLGDKNSPAQPSFYEYDTLGNVVSVSQGLSHQGAHPENPHSYVQHRYFKYDALSRLTHEKQAEQAGSIPAADPLTGNASWSRLLTYDEPRGEVSNMGLLSKAEDARHVYSFFHYDRLGRSTRVDYSGGTPSLINRYDQARTDDTPPPGGQAVTFRNRGRLTEVETTPAPTSDGFTIPETRQRYDYDLMGRTRRHRQSVGADTYELRYDYNLGGGVVSERYPSGRVVTYGYDDAGRLLNAAGGATVYAAAMTYKPFGAPESMTLGNGAVYSMAYSDERQQLSSISLTKDAGVLQKYEYKYGAVDMATGAVDETKNAGQVARIESTVGAQKLWQQRFKYDTLSRLAEAGEYRGDTGQQSYHLKYGYDPFGNRFQRLLDNPRDQSGQPTNPFPQHWVEDGAYSATNNRFTSGVTYDDAGNVVVDGRFRQRQFEYDANNRLRRSSHLDGSNAAQSVYDGTGQRVATMAGGQVTRLMVYDAAGDLVAEYGGAVTLNGTQYVMVDQQDSTRLTMRSAPADGQLVLAREDYLPFGEDVPGTVGLRAGVAGYGLQAGPRQKYAGMEEDEATGMSHTLWREFDSHSARWTAPDPYGGSMELESPQSFNRYTYVNNDPVNKVDPTGLMLSDIGIYQTTNTAVAVRLHRAQIQYNRDYNQHLRTQAQEKQKQPQQQPQQPAGGSGQPAPSTAPAAGLQGPVPPPKTAAAPKAAPAAAGRGILGRLFSVILAPFIAVPAIILTSPSTAQAPTPNVPRDKPPDEDKETPGTATINLYDRGVHDADYPHFSVTVTHNGVSLTTELATDNNVIDMHGGRPAVIQLDDGSRIPNQTLTVPLPNAKAALAYQARSLAEGSAGTFDIKKNNCLTHVNDVLRAGGLPAPAGTRRGGAYLRGLGLKE